MEFKNVQKCTKINFKSTFFFVILFMEVKVMNEEYKKKIDKLKQ